jgi:hypothetical protein
MHACAVLAMPLFSRFDKMRACIQLPAVGNDQKLRIPTQQHATGPRQKEHKVWHAPDLLSMICIAPARRSAEEQPQQTHTWQPQIPTGMLAN